MSEGRDLSIRWRSFSLEINSQRDGKPASREDWSASRRALRVMEAVRHDEGDGAVGPMYTEAGRRIHHDGENPLTDVGAVVAACGLDARYAEAADDAAWDRAIEASMDDAFDLAGGDVGSPVVVLSPEGGQPVGFFGPIVSPPPTGDAALQLWDGLTAAATVPGFHELKRSRPGQPTLGPRP